MNGETIRLARLSVPAKVLVTLFLLIVGPGYLCGTANIYFKHQMDDGEPGLTVDDLRAAFHGLEKKYQPDDTVTVNSAMLTEVRPDGSMREYLDKGGEPAVRALIKWLESEAKEADFDKPGLVEEGDPSAKAIIKAHCIECHNEEDGDSSDIPYATSKDNEPQYELVFAMAEPEITRHESGEQTRVIKPMSTQRLVHVTHAHVLSMPVFAFLVGMLFMATGLPNSVKLLLGPLPLLAIMLDIGSWWLARFVEPLIYVIAGAGGLFGAAYALQILCVLGSLWFGRKSA